MDGYQPKVDKESRLYAVAESQAGYFCTGQAADAGYSQRQLGYHTASGRFWRVRRGVYRLVYFPDSPREDLYVAWLQTGRSGVISHDSALELYELSDALPAVTHVTIPRTASRRHANLRLHTKHLQDDEVIRLDGLPVTTIPRTVWDVAQDGLAEELVVQAMRQAVERGFVSTDELESYLTLKGGRAARLFRIVLGESR